MRRWRPDSWKTRRTGYQPVYEDERKLGKVLSHLSMLPPLVSEGEIVKLKAQIAQAAEGGMFMLQGGDCAETFSRCSPQSITNQLKILLQMSVVLTYGAREPVIRIGRIAGQYAKPRSRLVERIKGVDMPAYFGDAVNSFEPVLEKRKPDPERLFYAFNHSCLTLNYIRSMIDGGFADLHRPHTWDLYRMKNSGRWKEYGKITNGILDAIGFMESFGGLRSEALGRVDFFTSHEGLLLDYESALTHRGQDGRYYNMSAHMLWMGNRTRGLADGHLEYFRGLANPIGVKLGPETSADELGKLMDILDPGREPGRLTLITRLGRDRAEVVLSRLIRAVKRTGRRVSWSCDPMHGNTSPTKTGLKTRHFQHVLDEISITFKTHERLGSRLAGVHFELTGENVTECTGGATGLKRGDLGRNYATYCDPRLNYLQSMEMAFLISLLLKSGKDR